MQKITRSSGTDCIVLPTKRMYKCVCVCIGCGAVPAPIDLSTMHACFTYKLAPHRCRTSSMYAEASCLDGLVGECCLCTAYIYAHCLPAHGNDGFWPVRSPDCIWNVMTSRRSRSDGNYTRVHVVIYHLSLPLSVRCPCAAKCEKCECVCVCV